MRSREVTFNPTVGERSGERLVCMGGIASQGGHISNISCLFVFFNLQKKMTQKEIKYNDKKVLSKCCVPNELHKHVFIDSQNLRAVGEENRQTDENGKPVVRVPIDDPYAWVKGEVREIVSWFSDEECVAELGDPSAWLKCAPSQIHPNAWGFIRGFEVLMEYLGCEPQLEVRSPVSEFPFYVDHCLLEKFPLYWYSEPVQILGMEEVNDECSMVVDFLEQNFCAKGLLSLNNYCNGRKKRNRFANTTTGGLKNFFKLKTARELSSNAIKAEKGVVVNQPAEKKKAISMKRRRAEGEALGKGKVIDLMSSRCCGKEVSLDEVKTFTENQRKLHGYMGAEDLSSVWSDHYPVTVVAEEHFQSKADMDLLESVGEIGRAQFMQVCATRMLYVGRYEELRAQREAEQKKAESVELEKSMEREKKVQLVMEQAAEKERELLEVKTESEELKKKVQKLEKERTDLEARVVELCGQKKEVETSKEEHGYDMLLVGFARAKRQAEFFFPEASFDKLYPIKVVHNGALIDDDEVDMEGGDDHNPEE
ncbi:hypothetical protein PIB30_095088 [Stylosanthes scabra]|uniref:Uncharacterized protein n=1 Tax=Stylosanthes scabra TaxID=79078 RepID=A0ABU6WTW0_9FABA|nr:hypothetical protein [Stylosanthes scabra]